MTSPSSKLQVNGGAAIGYSTATTAPATGLVVAGNTGIGTTAPLSLLQVQGTTNSTSIFSNQMQSWTVPGIVEVKNANSGGIAVGTFETGLYGRGRMDFLVSGAPASTNAWGANPNVTVMTLQGNGNVGIGTTTPGVKLSVSGGQIAGSYLSSANGSSGTPINWNSGNIQTTSIAAGTLYLDPASMVDGAGYTLILTNATGGSYTLSSTGYTFMCNPACPVTVTAAKHTIASMIKAGTVVYVSWVKDFQ